MPLHSARILAAGSLHGGPQSVSKRALHVTVRGATSDALKIRRTAVDAVLLVSISTALSGARRPLFGHSGKTVFPVSPV